MTEGSSIRMTRFRRHREAHAAQALAAAADQAAGLAVDPSGPLAGPYELKLAELGIDLKALREIQSVEKKIEAKRTMIVDYNDHVEGWIAGAHAALDESRAMVRDEVALTIMVWSIDIGAYKRALDIAALAIAGGLKLPDRYARTLGCLVAEEIAIAALADPATFDRYILDRTAQLTASEDMPDQVRAKLAKAQGLASFAAASALDADSDGAAGARRGLLEAAQVHLRRALGLDAKAGVKKAIEQVESALKKDPAS